MVISLYLPKFGNLRVKYTSKLFKVLLSTNTWELNILWPSRFIKVWLSKPRQHVIPSV